MAAKNRKEAPKKERKSGVMGALVEELNSVYNDLDFRVYELLANYTGETVGYKNKTIYSFSVNREYTCLMISGDVRSLEFLYPLLNVDKDFEELKDYLGKYKKPKRLFGESYDDKVLGKMTVPIRGLLSKIRLVIKNLEDVDADFSELESKSPQEILKPLTEGPLKTLRKDTNPLRESIRTMKFHVADAESWKNFRNTWEQLDQQLKVFSLMDFYGPSEK